MDVGAYGHDLAVDILERELAGTQAAVGAIVDAAVGNLQNAMLACHDAWAAKDGDAQSRGRGGAERDNLVERDLGESQNAPAPRSASASMQGVLCTGRQERISAVAPTWAARASSEMLPIATVAPATTPRVDALVVNGTADLVEHGARCPAQTHRRGRARPHRARRWSCRCALHPPLALPRRPRAR